VEKWRGEEGLHSVIKATIFFLPHGPAFTRLANHYCSPSKVSATTTKQISLLHLDEAIKSSVCVDRDAYQGTIKDPDSVFVNGQPAKATGQEQSNI
jgi:hypothetical protein